MQFVSSLDSQERTNSYKSRANEKLKRRSGSDTLTDPEDFQDDSQRGAYETPPPLSYRSPRVESDKRHDTLDEAEIQGKIFARQHHGSHIINTLNMARSRSRSKLQQENIPEQGIYQRPANFDPYHKYDHDSRMYTRYTDRQPLRESSTNQSNENSSFEYDDDRESVLDESDRYDSQSVMPGDISQFSKKSSVKASSRKRLEGDFVESEVQFTF